jgi:hypothetical protein
MHKRFLAWMTAGLAVATGLMASASGAIASGSPAATRIPHRWHTVSPPTPSGVSSDPLNLVSCVAAGGCMVIGTLENPGTAQAVSQFWNGKHWSAKMSPLPEIPSWLSCATARSCTAVGLTFAGGEATEMAEHWDGASWTRQTTSPPRADTTGSQLLGISCPAANSCFAIGDYHGKRGPRVPLAEHWDGSSWTLQTIAGPPSKTYFGFDGLSCSSPQFCVAVGDYGHGHGLFTDTWNGTDWTAKLITGPGSPAVSPLFAISCSSAEACLAVGIETAELWNGAKWRKVSPATPKGGSMDLLSVSCLSATDCEAVGLPSGTEDRSAELWNGRKWFIQTGLPTTTNSRFASVGQVSCVSQFNCLAVGAYQTRGAKVHFQPLASRYS